MSDWNLYITLSEDKKEISTGNIYPTYYVDILLEEINAGNIYPTFFIHTLFTTTDTVNPMYQYLSKKKVSIDIVISL